MMIFEKIALFFNPPLAGLDCLLDTRFIPFIFAHAYRQNNFKPVGTVVRGLFTQRLCSLLEILHYRYPGKIFLC